MLLAAALLVVGLALTGYFGVRAVRSFRQVQYIRQQGLDRGSANVDAVRAWMTLRFVSVAYAVPEEYLYSRLSIPFDRRNANRPLSELNTDNQLGPSPNGGYPLILDRVKQAISDYRANPVATGLRDVRPWMSVRYIANTSGVPAEYLFERIGLPLTGNDYKPLDMLGDELHYQGGPPRLVADLQRALSDYSESK